MGTNYYVRYNICDECGRHEAIHIGKSSAGWVFSLHVSRQILDHGKLLHGKDYPADLNHWKRIMFNGRIFDEYDTEHTMKDMLENIERRPPWGNELKQEDKSTFVDKKLNLMRSKVDGSYTIGNGESTYDLKVGECS